MSLDAERPSAESSPRFSFLTTAYRSESTLGRAIDAVRAQTSEDWELIVVDNGWDDAIADVVRPHLEDSRIRLLRQENRGPNGGVMAAASVAVGRYFTVLNSDDSITPDFCSTLGDVLDSDPGIAAVTCDAHLITDPGARVGNRSYLQHAGMTRRPDGRRRLRLAEVIDGPCPYYSAVVRRDVWQSLGGQECDTPIVDDLDFWLRMIGCGHDVRMVPNRLGMFLIAAGSESRPTDAARIEAFEEQRERALTRAATTTRAPEDAAALRRVLGRLHHVRSLRRARLAFLSGDTSAALGHARDAFRAGRTVRSAAVVVALRMAPTLLTRIHPLKQRIGAEIDRRRASRVS